MRATWMTAMRVWLGIVAVGGAGVGWGQPKGAVPPQGEGNAAIIVKVSPETLVDGVETEVEVTVAYELASHDKALLEITSNAMRAQAMGPFASQRVTKGSGTVMIRGKLTARHWGGVVPARVGAFLVVMDEATMQRRALANDQTRIALTLRPGAPETQATNPNPREVFEDGLRIKSITPGSFVAGQRVEVSVVVAYELLSREEGEVQFGLSRGTAPGYTVAASPVRVKMGKGEVTLTAWVTPLRTGSLPFGKVQAYLFEYPRRARSVALANDTETVEVR